MHVESKKGGSELGGISALRRAIIALTVILILGIAVFLRRIESGRGGEEGEEIEERARKAEITA